MTNSIRQSLLDVLRLKEVRDTEQYSADSSTISYRLRDRERAHGLQEPVSTIGDTDIGCLGFSVVAETLGTEIEFVGEHPQGICIMSMVSGVVAFRDADHGEEEVCRAGSIGVFGVAPGSYGQSADASSRINLWVVRSRLQRRLELDVGRPSAEPLRFAPAHRWPPGTGSSLRRLVAFAADELEDPYSLLAGGIGAAEFEDLVMRTLLEGVPNNYTDLIYRAPPPAAPLAYRRALEFMRAHLSEPLTITGIAAHVGCSPRALANACRANGGSTLSAVLQNMRLDAARKELETGHAPFGVAALARRFQFSNPGRFSRQFRTRFGELPRQAIKRSVLR